MALTNALFLLGLLSAASSCPRHQLPGLLGALASLLPTAALADALRIGLGASTGDLVGTAPPARGVGGRDRAPDRPHVPLGVAAAGAGKARTPAGGPGFSTSICGWLRGRDSNP